jgi:hypothetical protein
MLQEFVAQLWVRSGSRQQHLAGIAISNVGISPGGELPLESILLDFMGLQAVRTGVVGVAD